MQTPISFAITGLSCAGCVGRAERALGAVDGVTEAQVNLATNKATVTGGSAADLLTASQTAGYPAATQQVRLSIEGMNCASCTGRVETTLLAQTGVVSASVNLATKAAHVTVLDGAISGATLAKAVTDAGYAATSLEDGQRSPQTDEVPLLRRQTLIAGALTLPVFIAEMGGHLVPSFHHFIMSTIGMQTSWMIQFVLVTAVLLGPGWRFLRAGLPALVRGAPDMNALVAMGTLAAWAYSTVALFAPSLLPEASRAVYFEAAGVIVTLILLGRWLEARAKGRTGAAIAHLTELQPPTARVERNGATSDIPLAQVVTGDVIHLRPGERVAVDGTVTSGESWIDESMITGEPIPTRKTERDTVTGGTINGTGALVYQATAVGEDTMLARIIRMVEDAQGAKLPIQTLVDRVTRIFVPVVMGLAALTIGVWLVFGPNLSFALVAGVSVLIIACPCAMGLATPTSIMVGTGRAAEMGVLFRKGSALQTLSDARVIAFDKTGTLTQGKPELTTLDLAKGWSKDTVLPLVAAVEAQSEHPIAQAIVAAAHGLALPQAQAFETITGMGAQAQVEGKIVLVGADRFMAANGIELGPLERSGAEIGARGETPLYAAIDGVAIAAIGVSDPVKSGSAAALDALQKSGITLAMITGDNAATAQAIADRLGIRHVVAEVLPDGKIDALRDLQRQFGNVAFVGDGINDAPVLAQADTGIALGTGTDIAIEAADVVLMSGDLAGVVNATTISRATMRNIRQNLFWAFAYNAALIPVAAGVLYPFTGTMLSPMLAAGAMAMSSVFVVSNALRLRRVSPALTEAARVQETEGFIPQAA